MSEYGETDKSRRVKEILMIYLTWGHSKCRDPNMFVKRFKPQLCMYCLYFYVYSF